MSKSSKSDVQPKSIETYAFPKLNLSLRFKPENGFVLDISTDAEKCISNGQQNSDNEEEDVPNPTVDQICDLAESTANDALQIAKVYNVDPEEEDDLDNTTDSNVEDTFPDNDDEEEDIDFAAPASIDFVFEQIDKLNAAVTNRIDKLQTDVSDLKIEIASIRAMISRLVVMNQ